jgi:predicted GNAT family acetyltransferase
MTPIEITHNATASRFEATVDGVACRADYQLVDGVMRMTHTLVPAGAGLQGRALVLVRAHLHAAAPGVAGAAASGLRAVT